MMRGHVVAVYGPTGFTGRKVVEELRRSGLTPALVGRDRARLRALRTSEDEDVHVARLERPEELQRALAGAAAVINCVGPYETSAVPVAAAAVSNGAHYLDFTAEQQPLMALSEQIDRGAAEAGVALAPAFGFYGGMGDLLVAIAAAGMTEPREVTIAYAVDGWVLTRGSRAAAAAMAGRRWVWRGGRLELVRGEPRFGRFDYPAPRGMQPVMEDYPLPEAVSVPRWLGVPSLRLVMTASTLREVFGPDAPSPDQASHEQRSASRFTVVATVSDGVTERRAVATGRDIYGITAPMIAGATARLIGSRQAGVLAPSQAVEPGDLLASLRGHGLVVEPTRVRELIG
jgi:short subunit dehydrogenase-like uncharacterized protein